MQEKRQKLSDELLKKYGLKISANDEFLMLYDLLKNNSSANTVQYYLIILLQFIIIIILLFKIYF